MCISYEVTVLYYQVEERNSSRTCYTIFKILQNFKGLAVLFFCETNILSE